MLIIAGGVFLGFLAIIAFLAFLPFLLTALYCILILIVGLVIIFFVANHPQEAIPILAGAAAILGGFIGWVKINEIIEKNENLRIKKKLFLEKLDKIRDIIIIVLWWWLQFVFWSVLTFIAIFIVY